MFSFRVGNLIQRKGDRKILKIKNPFGSAGPILRVLTAKGGLYRLYGSRVREHIQVRPSQMRCPEGLSLPSARSLRRAMAFPIPFFDAYASRYLGAPMEVSLKRRSPVIPPSLGFFTPTFSHMQYRWQPGQLHVPSCFYIPRSVDRSWLVATVLFNDGGWLPGRFTLSYVHAIQRTKYIILQCSLFVKASCLYFFITFM